MHFEELINKVESSAEWRAGKAKQYPDDNRNIHSAQALEKLADKLKTLPDNDKNVAAYEAVIDRLIDSNANQISNASSLSMKTSILAATVSTIARTTLILRAFSRP